MSSKQEKLAAARKKLKEFQERNKDTDIRNKNINGNHPEPKSWEDYRKLQQVSSNVSSSSTPLFEEDENQISVDNKVPFFYNPTAHEEPSFYTFSQNVNSPLNDFLDNVETKMPSSVTQYRENNYIPNEGLVELNAEKHSIESSGPPSIVEEGSVSPKRYFEEKLSRPSSETGLSDVMRPLQQQLQNHVQTISLLVGERNTLQAALDELQSSLQKTTGDLQVMKERVLVSENRTRGYELNLQQYEEGLKKLQAERDDLLAHAERAKSEERTWREARDEMKERLVAKTQECNAAVATVRDLQSELSLAQIQIQQLNAGDANVLGPQLFEVQADRQRLLQRNQELERQLHHAVSEREQSSQNFQTYAQQCNLQISTIKKQMDHLISENQTLKDDNESFKKEVKTLKTEIEKKSEALEFETEIAELHSQIATLTDANSALLSDVNVKDEEVKRLREELSEREHELEECAKLLTDTRQDNTRLEAAVEGKDSSEKLLAAMESDKVAAARAVSQNVKLKEQLLELETGFIRISDEKLDLTDKLEHERHVNKELVARLQELEIDGRHSQEESEGEECCHDHEHNHEHGSSEGVEELRNAIVQLQNDKSELLARLNAAKNGPIQRDEVEMDEVEKADLVRQMEEKVRRTMNEIAKLDEEKERLEHLVMQLQGETETIGEYISLYHKQRMVLRQRSKEKDEQLLQVSQDREQLKAKLTALDDLVQGLLAAKDSELLPGPDAAGEIRALIDEIGSTSLVSPHHGTFEHCPCCSGRLITI